jgi:hypothetical protein
VQTGDNRILAKGTAYMSDIGMIGPAPGVIGSQSELAIRRQQTQMPLRMEIEDLPADFHGLLLTIDKKSGKTKSTKLINQKSI